MDYFLKVENKGRKLTKDQERDLYKHYSKKLPSGFSEDGLKAHNDFVIEQTIKKTNARRAEAVRKYREAVGERTEAAVAYLRSPHAGLKGIEEFLGPKMMAYLRGERIVADLKILKSKDDEIQRVYRLSERG